MKTSPGSTLKVVEAQFFLELLMRLFTNPSGLDGTGDVLDRSVAG